MSVTDEVPEKQWAPLESNPDVVNTYVEAMGVDVRRHAFVDVLSCEEWAQDMIPRPVLAVVFLYPLKDTQSRLDRVPSERDGGAGRDASSGIYYMKQRIGNACGTVAILHAIGNNLADTGGAVRIIPGSYLEGFFRATRVLSPEEIATQCIADEVLERYHASAAVRGQSEQTDDVNTHFVCFTCVGETLYELDGRKPTPVNHGPCLKGDLLRMSCSVIQGHMLSDPHEMRFAILALTTKNSDEA